MWKTCVAGPPYVASCISCGRRNSLLFWGNLGNQIRETVISLRISDFPIAMECDTANMQVHFRGYVEERHARNKRSSRTAVIPYPTGLTAHGLNPRIRQFPEPESTPLWWTVLLMSCCFRDRKST